MKRALIVVAVTAVVVGVPGYGIQYLWSGGYRLAVTVSYTGERPVWVCAIPFRTRSEAEEFLPRFLDPTKPPPFESAGPYATANPFDRRALRPTIDLDGCRSLLFGELVDPQYQKALLVVAERPDGDRVGTVVEIPDYRVSKSVTVTLP